MFSKNEKLFSGILLLVCAILAIAGYSFSKTSSSPKRVWLDATGGDVIFDHEYHLTLAECYDCHHNYDPKKAASAQEMNCRVCHYYGKKPERQSSDPIHPRFVGANCTDCHRKVKMDVTCSTCHIRQGFAFEESARGRPPLPAQMNFETDNGRVIFDHKIHISKEVGQPCVACHHECRGGKVMMGMPCKKNCRACHYDSTLKIPEGKDENHKRHIGGNCITCHDSDDCSMCHREK